MEESRYCANKVIATTGESSLTAEAMKRTNNLSFCSAILLGCLTYASALGFNSRGRIHVSRCPNFDGETKVHSLATDDMDLLHQKSRRLMIQRILLSAFFASGQSPSLADMTDETASFATASLDDSYTQQTPTRFSSLDAASPIKTSILTPTDEVTITINKKDLQYMQAGLGLELGDISFRSNSRVVVKSVAPNSLAEKLGIQPSWVVVSVNGAEAERTDAAGVAVLFSRSFKAVMTSSNDSTASIKLTFRDPSRFRSDLQNFPTDDTQDVMENVPSAVTKVAPAGETKQNLEESDQVVQITQLIAPRLCQRRATTNDLLEISYIGRIVETGAIFDGSAVMINGQAIPGRGNDVSIFFVLGKQPPGQFPVGWDVGLEGICVGERRRLVIPPVLAYGEQGVPRRGIPPNASIQYDVTLVSMNGLATPQ